jgi:hypothetical protein
MVNRLRHENDPTHRERSRDLQLEIYGLPVIWEEGSLDFRYQIGNNWTYVKNHPTGSNGDILERRLNEITIGVLQEACARFGVAVVTDLS